ncbi:nucleotidyltransferase [Streptomyces tateyamensis]|uniref:Nucleotidyltransferase n=1 Tax=Streptomyces tateyamensis TaxID=565073 RepID=A0A2V4N4K2_9ACTN|nr:nucleotidyltransferase domain-containing protein [Streptomyces tateyamensis]PYC76278.1 nucleotidyltransferase [Streptomyces tateyamensis]
MDETEWLVARFVAGLRALLPVRAVWAHGSLALGDYQPGRSDLDLLALLERAPDPAERERLTALHRELERASPLALELHCSYLLPDRLADPALDHLTWAHRELLARPVSEVTRRELQLGARTVYGPPPAGLLPGVTDEELARAVRASLMDFWRPALPRWHLWLRDDWVDLGLYTLARATATLRTGELLTKGQALALLPEFGVSTAVLADLRARRYGGAVNGHWRWKWRRSLEVRRVLAAGIARAVCGAAGAQR